MQAFTLPEIWAHMSIFNKLIAVFLALMSISSLLVLFERLFIFSKTKREARSFAAKMAEVLSKGDLDRAAREPVQKNVGDLGRVINSGLVAYKIIPPGGGADVSVESVARALERQSQREVQSLKRGLGLLATVGSTAPFVGLLGTTIGIVVAFQSMAVTGSGGLGTISAAIGEALIATAFGLLVAIPAVMGFNYCQGWVDARTVDLSESSNEFLDLVARKVGGTAQTPQQPQV